MSGRPSEVTTVHTRLLRLALGVEDSRAYWAHVDPAVAPPDRATSAFEERWFGPKSMHRVRYLLANFVVRYDAYPQALAALRRWRSMEPATRRLVCHWHVQLSDPIYRAFTGEFLPARRLEGPRDTVDFPLVLRWVREREPVRWAVSTCAQFAGKLLSAAFETGLVGGNRDPRLLTLPRVPDVAIAYLLYLLRGVEFGGTLLDNPYFASVGLGADALADRLRQLPGVAYRRMAHLHDWTWAAPDLATWAEGLDRAEGTA